jgi:hypothetical protein
MGAQQQAFALGGAFLLGKHADRWAIGSGFANTHALKYLNLATRLHQNGNPPGFLIPYSYPKATIEWSLAQMGKGMVDKAYFLAYTRKTLPSKY